MTTSWQEPGVYEVAAGVYRIPLPLPDDGLRAVNAYALADSAADAAGVVLIDPGQALPAATERLRSALGHLGFRTTDVRACLTTHVHRDHYTNAVALRTEVGCRVSLGERERPSLELIGDPAYGRIRSQLDMLPMCDAAELLPSLREADADDGLPVELWQRPDRWLATGTTIDLGARRLEVVHTPGHTRGHVVFHDLAEGLLFSGDHVLPHITPSIAFEPAVPELPLADYLDSLRHTLSRPDARLLPAHGPVTASAHERVEELLEHHDRRLTLAHEQVLAGRGTVHAIAAALRWTRRERRLEELDPINRLLAILETKAHLDVLAANGRLDRQLRHGTLHYAAPARRTG